MKKAIQVLALSLFIVSVLFFSPATLPEVVANDVAPVSDTSLAATDYVPGNIRVAIYDEPNMTIPDYITVAGGRNNNVTGLMDILVSYGFDVTLLDVHDIYNYELTTVNYDVLCIVDNFPRENITTRVMDFWLGGGGLLVFDGSAEFLCNYGVLPPEAIGTSGTPAYWDYSSNNFVFTGIHPVSKSVTGSISTTSSGFLHWDFIALQTTAIAGALTKVATSSTDPNTASILAFEPTDRGGKIVTIATDLVHEQVPELYPVYADAVEWLTPRPKARILFDLTHQPWCPTDPWEWNGDSNFLTTWRNTMVSNRFTVDKLNPSALGNLTLANLAPYDMLVTNQPMLSYSTPEINAVEEWVQAGGGLFAIGDNPGVPDNYNLDDLIAPYGFQFNDTVAPYSTGVFTFDMHPTTEDCTSLVYQGATNLILSGGAYPIWSYAPGEVAAAASEYGEGRVVVICDANSVLDAWIGGANNYEFAMNVANWLTTAKATVLLYHDISGIFPYNHYQSAVADALNELGIEFMLTYDYLYFNLSMQLQEWDLIICDSNQQSSVVNYRFILEHLENGGKLIMRDFIFRYPNGSNGWDLSLFPYIGFEGAGATELITTGAPTVYMWDGSHNVFDRPVNFAVDRFESTANFFSTDWTNVTLLGNATAIAGITPTPEVNQSAIVLGVEGRALCNMFSISQYFDDYDLSGYADNFELWLNEIAYMMQPTIDSPGDLEFDLAGSSLDFEWPADSYAPSFYLIKRDSVIITNQVWDGLIIVDVSGLSVGVYEFELIVNDIFEYHATDTISVTIVDTTPTTPTTTPTVPPPPLDGLMILVLVAAAGVVIIIVVIFLMKKKK